MTVAAFDIECEDWDQYVVGAFMDTDGDVSTHWNEDALFDAIMEHGGDVWAWNAGRYDMIWFAEVAVRRGLKVTARVAGGAPVSMKCGKVVLKDGFKLFPEKLASVAELAGLEKAPTGLDCKREGACEDRDCGGFCRIKRKGMTFEERRLLADYVAHDTRVCGRVVGAIKALADEHGIVLKSTVGASAWATLRDAFHAPKAEWKEWRDYKAARRGYYGGRTELYQTGCDLDDPNDHRDPIPIVWRADINSAYPAALKNQAVPCGDYRRLFDEAASQAFSAGRPGVYDARVVVPDCHVPPLPTRGKDRLLFVTGRFAGSWTHVELQNAVKAGVRIEKITAAIVWAREETIAREFMEVYWALRKRYGKKSPQGRFFKWFVNSATGKLAMRPQGERCVLNPLPGEAKQCPHDSECFTWGPRPGPLCGRTGGCCRHTCTRTCGKWNQLDKKGLLWSAPEFRLSDCMHVQWAGTLTATTRVEWYQQAVSVGEDMVYGDTDSIYASRRVDRRIGDDLGEWNDEGVGLDWYSRGPKAYRYAEPETGEYKTRSKGVPGLDGFEFDRWAGGEPVTLTPGVWGLKGGSRRGDIFRKRTGADGKPYQRAARADPRIAGSRLVDERGRTRPQSWEEYQASLEARQESHDVATMVRRTRQTAKTKAR